MTAYSRALKSLVDPKQVTLVMWTNTPESKRTPILDLYRKLAQAALAAGRVTEAQSHLDTRASLVGWLNSLTNGKSTGLKLPSRLIVSVSKSTLDAAGGNQLNLEDFKKQAKVKHVSLSAN